MNPRYLLDTNIVSYVLKGSPFEVRTRVEQVPSSWVAVSAITAAELRFWIAKRPLQSLLRFHIEDFLERVPILAWDAAAAASYGNLKLELLTSGLTTAELDMQIASHALALNAILITHDRAFRRIPNLQVEDWVD